MHAKLIVITLLGSLASTSVLAQNMGFLTKTPIASFDAQDIALMREAGKVALDTLPPGESKSWRNAKSGSEGSITVAKAYEGAGGIPCKRISVFNKARGIEGDTRYNYCKRPDKGWVLENP